MRKDRSFKTKTQGEYPMTWVRADLIGAVTDDRRILVETTNLLIRDEQRPDHPGKVGIDEAAFEQIRRRTPGPINTPAFVGGATAFMVNFARLALLGKDLMKKLRDKFGPWYGDAVIMLVRNTAAGAVWNAAEPAGGMAEDINLELEALKEACEVGIYNKRGWLSFALPPSVERFQQEFDTEQAYWWKRVDPKLHVLRRRSGCMQYTGHCSDTWNWNGISGIVGVGPVGDAQITRVVRLDLPHTRGGWRIVDCECRPGNPEKGEPDWVPLRRKAYAIVKRKVGAPVMFELTPDGSLHPGGLHVILDGENIQHALTHVGRSVLEALGWI